MSRPLYPRERDVACILQEVGWAPGPVWKDGENLASTGIRSPDHPNHSVSLYRLSYPGPSTINKTMLTLWRRIFFFNFSTPVYKMRITQEPKKVALWNKRHFEEKKTESVQHVWHILYVYLLKKYMKCNIWRLAVRYDIYEGWLISKVSYREVSLVVGRTKRLRMRSVVDTV